jgi:nucleotide-binding universal stress UspA family protein
MKILIALDESPVSARAAREAGRLFSGADAEFLVINVTPVPLMWAGGDGYPFGYGMVAPLALDSAWLDDAGTAETALVARAKAAGLSDAEALTTTGDPVRLICLAAEDHDVDVIVVGSHDKSALRRLIDPSVAVGIVRETYRPVLVVSGEPPSDESDS